MKRFEFPGFIDVHVHFRDPGVPEAETTASGLTAAARGGFAAVVTMPNTNPPLDSPERIRGQYEKADSCFRAGGLKGERVRLFPSACITKGRLGKEVADLETLAEAGAAFFTDDGTYVPDLKVLEEAMRRAYDLNMVVCQHALSPEFTEAEAIARDLSVCRETGCRYHVQHISTAAGVQLIRDAQSEGLPVTAEATPHHLLLTKDDIPVDNSSLFTLHSSLFTFHSSLFKMAPPLATKEDRAELRKAVKDGVLMFATDHAPHPASKKNVPYDQAANGIIGLEAAVPITYKVMVEEEGMRVDAWAKAWHEMPAALIRGLDSKVLKPTVVEVGNEKTLDLSTFASLSRNCPYNGMKFSTFPC